MLLMVPYSSERSSFHLQEYTYWQTIGQTDGDMEKQKTTTTYSEKHMETEGRMDKQTYRKTDGDKSQCMVSQDSDLQPKSTCLVWLWRLWHKTSPMEVHKQPFTVGRHHPLPTNFIMILQSNTHEISHTDNQHAPAPSLCAPCVQSVSHAQTVVHRSHPVEVTPWPPHSDHCDEAAQHPPMARSLFCWWPQKGKQISGSPTTWNITQCSKCDKFGYAVAPLQYNSLLYWNTRLKQSAS